MLDYFKDLIGNDKIKQYLTKVHQRGIVPQSLLFSGPEGIGKSLFAGVFAKCVINTSLEFHPDIHHFYPEGKVGMHTIQSMRQLTEQVYLAPFQANKKVFIIHDAHRMLASSANALLKTFEEPALDCVIILTSNQSERILPTILSRCQQLRFQPIPIELISTTLQKKCSLSKEEAAQIAGSSGGSLGKALKNSNSEQDVYSHSLLSFISDSTKKTYPQILHFVKEISAQFDVELKSDEQNYRTELLLAFADKPTAYQKLKIDTEIDGYLSIKKFALAKSVFETLLYWYRDLHLIQSRGDKKYLYFPEYHERMVQVKPLSFETVQKAINETILSLERSTSLELCFENLFLKLV